MLRLVESSLTCATRTNRTRSGAAENGCRHRAADVHVQAVIHALSVHVHESGDGGLDTTGQKSAPFDLGQPGRDVWMGESAPSKNIVARPAAASIMFPSVSDSIRVPRFQVGFWFEVWIEPGTRTWNPGT